MKLATVIEWWDKWALKALVIAMYCLMSLMLEALIVWQLAHGEIKAALKSLLLLVIIGLLLCMQLVAFRFFDWLFGWR